MKIKEFFSTKEKWTQKTSARDKNGKWVSINDNNASCWCLFGAINKCYSDEDSRRRVIIKVKSYIGDKIASWNDDENRTFEEVKALCEKLDI